MKGPQVGDLQDALQVCLERKELYANDEVARQELSTELKNERVERDYAKTTQKLVSRFQEDRTIQISGSVDEPTAVALNKLLDEWGLLSETPAGGGAARVDTRYSVRCFVIDNRGQPIPDLRVEALHKDPTSPHDPLGEPATTDAQGLVNFWFRRSDFAELPGELGPDLYFIIHRGQIPLQHTLKIGNDHGVIRNFQQQPEPITIRIDHSETIQGVVLSEHMLPVRGLKLRLYRRDFGGQATRLNEANETITGEDGRYVFAYKADDKTASLEVRAVTVDGQEVLLTKPLNELSTQSSANLNLMAPASLQPLAAEYNRLSDALKPLLGGDMAKLTGAREDTEQQDITVLNRATGWDARLITLGIFAERLKAEADVGLPSDALYGLLRAGLPSDKQLLAQVDPDVVETAIKKVRDAGIVAIDDAGIADLKTQFTTFANKARLAIPAPGSRSTYGDFLGSSGLSKADQDKFAPIFLQHAGSGSQLWEEARKTGPDGKPGLDSSEIGKLQLQGKLAFLAGNSEPMTKWLLNKKLENPDKNLENPVELAEQGFHSAAAWKTEVFDQAGIPPDRRAKPTRDDLKKLEGVIPAMFASGKVEARLDAYAEDMARKVRLSYPTQVLGHLMDNDENFKLPSGHDATVTLLKNATAQGFRLGETPLSRFLQSRPGVEEGLSDVDFQTASEQLKMMQRVYQITPSNEAMPVLIKLDITSAYDVMAHPEEQFASLFRTKYLEINNTPAPVGLPELIIRKSKQVSSVTHNLFTIAKKLDSEPPVAGISAPLQVRESVRNELIKHFPTMESLFGSMDYCECEHCRSVLSPAAYLVDLLQFVDTEQAVWVNFQTHWRATHGNKEYPHKNAAGVAMKPYDVLIERRPDLPHIALTCENTHTALPYIDIVNEILEYYVANGKLAKETARDTGDATTAELLAEPQNVINKAYDTLRSASYPLNLPFDLWLETVRKFCDYFETPLHRVLEVIRPDEDLSALIVNPTNVGNATVNVANVDATRLTNGAVCTYLAASTSALSGETKRISGIGAANSGGQDQTTITFEGIWKSAPVAGDRLVSRPLDRRSAIFMESLGLAPAEVEIFADANPLPNFHTLYGFATQANATTEAKDATGQRIDLNSAKALSRRLGVTYKEITDIVQTGFVNPDLGELTLLYKLDVSVRDAEPYQDEKKFYEANKDLLGKARSELSESEQKRFDALAKKVPKREVTGWQVLNKVAAFIRRLADLAEVFDVNVDFLENAILTDPFKRVLVLAEPDTGCNFDLTTLQFANGDKADAIDFLRINLFVRLWRKLGWSIEETDRALTTFVPRSTPFDATAANLAKRPLKTALIYLAHFKALDEKLKVGKQSRLKLLTLWSDIATSGKTPLYAQLFLKRSVLKSSPVFDHPLGQYLRDPAIKLKAHVLALQGALGLSADEIGRILADASKKLDEAELSLANVSLLYRYGLLAKALKLSVRDLIALKQISGLDPFRQLEPDTLASLDQDHPFTQTLEFVKVAEEVKDSGLKIEDLDYLLRHRFDEIGNYRSDREPTLALLKSLSEGIRAIRVEHAVPDDPGALSDDVLRKKLGLALLPDIVERFLGMVNTTAEFTATMMGVEDRDKLNLETFASEERIRQVSYKALPHKEQKLTVRGVMFAPAKEAIKANFADVHVLTARQQEVFAQLLDGAEQLARKFFNNRLKKQMLRLEGEAGFLDEADFESLFAPLEPLKAILSTDDVAAVVLKRTQNEEIQKKNLEELQKRRNRIGRAFLPILQERLIRQFIVQTITARTGADPVLVESLIADDRLLASPKALLDVFTATAMRGLNATFWDAATGMPTTTVWLDADTGAKDGAGNPLKRAGDDRALFEAYLEVHSTGAYRFYVEMDKQGIRARLGFPHRPEPVLVQGVAGNANATLSEYLELKAGVLYRLSLDLWNLTIGDARLLVQGETVPKGPLSQLTLYPAATIDAAARVTTLLNKALQLVQSLGLSEREIRYLLTHAADFDGITLSELPTATVGNTLNEKTSTVQRFRRFRRLAAYARLKRDLAGGTDDLIAIFEANGTIAEDRLEKQVYPLIAKLSRRDEATVKASAEALVKAPSVPVFESERPLWRLLEALQVVERFGVPPASLLGWADIVSSATTGQRRFELAREVKESIKARFEPETWQRIAQPIFDKLRPRQRDALVSHVLQKMRESPETASIDTQEKLYEYFLVDPGMEPVVQTSRIRLAIASLQLFIQRCLLNLEAKVHPSTITAKQWEWMKRYRVWEANRKIFLFPENWLEPEFRDDKTHLFAELEGALLQGDVSSDLVEDAFLNYLKKLDELARLYICAMHMEDNVEPALRVLHVFGRTYSQPHKYFYRRYAHQMWTPWEPVSAEIEGDHLVPVIWRDRLYLFWVTFTDQADPKPSTGNPTDSTRLTDLTLAKMMTNLTEAVAMKQVDVQLHWSEHLNGEWSTRESSGFSGLITQIVPASFSRNSVFVHVSKNYDPADGTELGVFIHLSGEINRAFYLAGRNSTPESATYRTQLDNPFSSANATLANRYSGSGALTVVFGERITTEAGKTPPKANRNILATGLTAGERYTLVPCNLGVSRDAFQAPRWVVNDFGYGKGWHVEIHPRFLADLTGDGRADIVGFYGNGVHVALNNGDGTFQEPSLVVANFGYIYYAQGVAVAHPLFLADLTGDGRADIVGFVSDGVHVALNNGDGTFQAPKQVVPNFFGSSRRGRELGYRQTPTRFLADLTGDGRADIVGFYNEGVHVALNNGDGTFQAPQQVVPNFFGSSAGAGSWDTDKHLRVLADLTGDGRADIVGFYNEGVHVALNNGDGTFQAPKRVVLNYFGSSGGAGSWRCRSHPRFLADLTGGWSGGHRRLLQRWCPCCAQQRRRHLPGAQAGR
jgi:hypothetical protein